MPVMRTAKGIPPCRAQAPGKGFRRGHHGVRLWLFGMSLLFSSACVPLGEEGSSMARGDEAFARGDLDRALAEYKLAEIQGGKDPSLYARVAHVCLRLRRVDDALAYYRKAVGQDSTWADQAASDFARLARESWARGDRFNMAAAVEAALEFRPGMGFPELALALARHYTGTGEFGRALPYFQDALVLIPESRTPDLLFEMGVAYEEVGDCEGASLFYEEYREKAPPARKGEVDWRLGNCAFRTARMRLEAGDETEALRHLEILLRLGEPRNLLPMAYFQKGEILGRRGECQEALEAFRQVGRVDPAGASPLAERAAERMDQIRFGRRGTSLLDRLRGREENISCFPSDPGPRRGGAAPEL